MNRKIVDFVNKLKNSSLINRKEVSILYSKLVLEYVDCLYREGFLQSYYISNDNEIKKICLILRVDKSNSLTSEIQLISTITKKRYLTSSNIHSFSSKRKELFISTSLGILSLSECKKKNIGGFVVFGC